MQIHFQEMRQSVEMFLQNYALFALLLPVLSDGTNIIATAEALPI